MNLDQIITPPATGTANLDEHKQVAGWGGGLGACGVECACGVTFDGFDSVGDALDRLTRHIEDETRSPFESMTELPAAPTIPAAPGWATASTPGDDATAHDYESPVTVGFHSDAIHPDGTPYVQRVLVTLSQVDEHERSGGAVTTTTRQPAEVTLTTAHDYLSMPVAEAEVLHAVLGGLLARYRLAEPSPYPATGRKFTGTCLIPGCESPHRGAPAGDCSARVEVGDVLLDFGGIAHVAARATIARDGTWADVVIEDLQTDVEGRIEASAAQARLLAALLVEAADRTDAIAGGSR